MTKQAYNPRMFVKLFAQIFDSSIASDANLRHVFMDLLVMADSDGVVDMTDDAIARRANMPLATIQDAIKSLSAPDPLSRSGIEEGRRIIPIDPKRPWGWQIVNYQHYRGLRTEESRRDYFREYRRKEREAKRPKKKKDPLGKATSGRETLSPRPPKERVNA